MRNCLIAGCGDVGTRLGLLLAAAGVAVHGITRGSRLPEPLVTHHADLMAPAPPLPDGAAFDAVVYLPAPARRDEASYRALFLQGPARLLDALASPPRRLLLVSSTAVYGEDGGARVDESTPPAPTQWNGRVLLQAEQALQRRLPGCVVVRFAGIYGPGREAMLARARSGAAVVGQRWTNRIHVDDAAAALRHLLRLPAPAATYLGSDGHPATEAEVLQWLAARMGAAPIAQAEGPVSGRRVDSSRLQASGFECAWPDYRAGYGAMLATPTLTEP